MQTMDAQEGVLYYLLDQMADQHTKETLLAYVVLLISGVPGGLQTGSQLSPPGRGFRALGSCRLQVLGGLSPGTSKALQACWLWLLQALASASWHTPWTLRRRAHAHAAQAHG